MNRLSATVAFALLLGCAAPRAKLSGPRPARVVVLARTLAALPPPQGVLDLAAGGDDPARVLAREAERLLRRRGYLTEVGPVGRSGARLLVAAPDEAALVLTLERLDLSALQTLGRAGVDLDARLISGNGQVLWASAFRGEAAISTYRSRQDWRSHLREALGRAMRDLP
jgi:hypothetical protein